MTSTEEKETGFINQIRRLSRRLSGNILTADSKDVRAYYNNAGRKNIFAYDEDGLLKIGKHCGEGDAVSNGNDKHFQCQVACRW